MAGPTFLQHAGVRHAANSTLGARTQRRAPSFSFARSEIMAWTVRDQRGARITRLDLLSRNRPTLVRLQSSACPIQATPQDDRTPSLKPRGATVANSTESTVASPRSGTSRDRQQIYFSSPSITRRDAGLRTAPKQADAALNICVLHKTRRASSLSRTFSSHENLHSRRRRTPAPEHLGHYIIESDHRDVASRGRRCSTRKNLEKQFEKSRKCAREKGKASRGLRPTRTSSASRQTRGFDGIVWSEVRCSPRLPLGCYPRHERAPRGMRRSRSHGKERQNSTTETETTTRNCKQGADMCSALRGDAL